MKNYTPAPDSLAARMIQHFTNEGGTLTPGEIAALFEVPRGSVSNTVKAAVQRGLIAHYSAGRGKVVYYLPGSTVTLPDATEAPAETAATPATRKKTPWTTRTQATRVNGKHVLVATPARGPAEPMQPPAVAALWDDGDIVLYGATINSDDTVTVTDAQARRLHRFLERVFGPNE